MRYERKDNPSGFIRENILPNLSLRETSKIKTVIGIDECLNNKHIQELCRKLLIKNIISEATPLWHSMRETQSGDKIVVMGDRIHKNELIPDIGYKVPGYSCPDELVVSMMIAHFCTNDRLCLLTQDMNHEKNGLRDILENEVAPAITSIDQNRIGILILVKTPKITMMDYISKVLERLTKDIVHPGFSWDEIT